MENKRFQIRDKFERKFHKKGQTDNRKACACTNIGNKRFEMRIN